MNISEFRELTLRELRTRKRELQEESFKLCLRQKSGQLEKPTMLRTLRRNIARIETVVSEKTKANTHQIVSK